MQIGYKVLRDYANGGLYSTSLGLANAQPIRYNIDEIIKAPAKNKPLFLFEAIDEAVEFARIDGDRVVYKCLYEESEIKMEFIANLNRVNIDDYVNNVGRARLDYWPAPSGTIYASELCLVEKVYG